MTYRVRRQAFTGKLILQSGGIDNEWHDCSNVLGWPVFEMVLPHELAEMEDRIAKYERRAEGQRKANEARKSAKLEVLIVGPQEMAP